MNDKWKRDVVKLREWNPQHLLFLCVANSARSQLAEAIARSLAPDGVRISSAGSRPSTLNPLVDVALREAGIDSSGLHSKGMDAVDLSTVQAVVTLCADEICPVFLKPVLQLHWALPDPAAVESESERLEAFRSVRDELIIRLSQMYAAEATK